MNDFWHMSHENGFSPVWIRLCSFMYCLFENFLLQTSHVVFSASLDSLRSFLIFGLALGFFGTSEDEHSMIFVVIFFYRIVIYTAFRG